MEVSDARLAQGHDMEAEETRGHARNFIMSYHNIIMMAKRVYL